MTKLTIETLVSMGDLLGPSKVSAEQRRRNYRCWALLESDETLETARTEGLTMEHWSRLQKQFAHAWVVVSAWNNTVAV